MTPVLSRHHLFSRLAQGGLVLLVTFTISFILVQLMPGDAVLIRFLNPEMGMTPEDIARIRVFYGSDASIPVQYLHSLLAVLSGDFGYSVQSGVPVSQEIATNLPPTLLLASLALLTAVTLSAVLAWGAVLGPFAGLRRLIRSIPPLMVSVPVFWVGITLIQLVSFKLGWVSVIAPGPWEKLVLPVLTLALPIAAPIAQILIRNIEDVSTRAFVPVARAKGLSRGAVLRLHVLRNAALPTLAISGVLLGELIAGAVVTETVFGLNGLGRLAERSVRTQDIAVLQAIVLISALGFVAISFIVDLVSLAIDPRLRQNRSLA